MSRRSFRLAIGLFLILAIAYTGASWQAGRMARQYIEAWVVQVNQKLAREWSTDDRPVLRVDSYRQGLFRSRIEYVLDYRDAQGRAQTLGLRDALQHGPWPWAALREGHWQPLAAYSRVTPLPGGAWQPWFDAMAEGTPPWTLQSRIGFDGRTVAEGHFMPLQSPRSGLSFSGGTLHVEHDPAVRHTTVTGQWASLALKDAETGIAVTLEGLALDGEYAESGESDRRSRQRLRVDKLDILRPSDPPVTLREQTLVAEMAQTGSLLDSRTEYSAGQLQSAGQNLGKIRFAASAEHLDVPALQALARTLEQIDAANPPDAEPSAEDLQRIHAGLIPVLAAAPRFSLQALSWTNDAGTTELRAQADFRPVDATASGDPGDLVEQGIRRLTLHLQVSRPMLLQVLRSTQPEKERDMTAALVSVLFDQYADRLQNLGLAMRADDGIVRSDLAYADGQVTANGATMSPGEFMGRIQALGLSE